MAFSDLCHIGKAYKTVENETDQSERIMEENSMVRDLITKILDETGPAEGSSSIQSPEKTIVSGLQSNYPKNDTINTSYIPPSYNTYQNNIYSFTQNDQNGFNNFNNIKNGFGNTNGFVNYPDNDVSALLGIDPVTDTSTDTVTPEQLNLLRLAAQEIGGAQFTTANKFDDKYYNFFEPNQRNSLPETNNMFGVTSFNRPNSLNLDMNYNSNYDFGAQRYTNSQDPNEILSYLSQLNVSLDRARDENMVNNMDFKMPMDLNGHYHSDFNKTKNNTEEQNKVFYNNRNYQQQLPSTTANNNNNFYEIMSQVNDRSPLSQNFDFANAANTYKPNNGFHQTDYLPRRDMNQILGRDNFQSNGTTQIAEQRTNSRENIQQAALIRQNQELARQMNLLMRNRQPPATQLNVDVSFLHETNPFNIGPSPTVPPPVLPSPMLELPLLAPFYAMRNMRGAATSSSILHGRLDACYEQWRQLERERKRTEARLALAYPGRAVSSSNSIPVPRLPPCPTRVDRLTVDMLREHTKVLTLMGKMETLRASVCVTHNKKPSKTEDSKITVLKRGQENVASEKESGIDLGNFDPSTWREDVRNLSEIAPHSEVESAMLSWRNAVGGVQAARRRELTPHHQHPHPHPHATRYTRNDPILQLADAVKQLSICARRARCAMWCDLTLTVALAPDHHHHHQPATTTTASTTVPAHSPTTTTLTDICTNENSQKSSQPATPVKQPVQENTSPGSSKQNAVIENKDEKPAANETKTDNSKTTEATCKTTTTPTNKQADKQDKSRRNQYRKLNQGRNDFYQKNQRYDARFMHNRPPYHYLATGSIN